MTQDYATPRDLIQRLTDALEMLMKWDGWCEKDELDLLSEARTHLAQPELQGPTEEELDEETATLIPWLLEQAVMAANSEAPYAAGQLTLAAQLLDERCPAVKPVPKAS
jgi:hypothetical protein